MGPMMLRLMKTSAGRGLVRSMISGLTHRGKALSAEATDAHWLALREGGTVALRAFAQELGPFVAQFERYAEALRRLDVPATVIWGTEDPVLKPQALVHRFAEDLRIPAKNVHLLDGASHFLQEDRPDEIAGLISRFIVDQVAHTATAKRSSK